MHLRELMPTMSSAESDRIFETYDDDGSGTLDLSELKVILRRLKEAAKEVRLASIAPRERAAALRKRAALVREAAQAVETADSLDEELRKLKDELEGTLEVMLGHTLNARRIKVGELVGAWSTSTGKHRGELSRAEFRDNVRILLPKTTPAYSIDALFDRLDIDGSGYMDFKEAKLALKGLAERAAEATRIKEEKTAECARVRRMATKKAQKALTPLNPPPDLPPPEEVMAEATPAPATLFSSYSMGLAEMMARKRQDTERKRTARRAVRLALMRLGQRSVARGWQAWVEHHEIRLRQYNWMNQVVRRMVCVELCWCWQSWQTWLMDHSHTRALQRDATRHFELDAMRRALHQWAACATGLGRSVKRYAPATSAPGGVVLEPWVERLLRSCGMDLVCVSVLGGPPPPSNQSP